MGVPDKVEGELVALQRVKRKEWDEVHEHFQDPDLHLAAGLKGPPEKPPLFEDLDEDELFVYHVTTHDEGERVAYAILVHYDGPPYILVHFFSKQVDVDIAGDAMLLMVMGFFQNTEEPQLYTFVPRPVPEAIHDKLLEGGFDPIDDYPVIDNTEEACYCLERFTYEAYYQDEEDDEVEELEF